MSTIVSLHNYPEENLISLPSDAIARFGRGSVQATAISPDGNTIAVATRIGVWLYNAHTEDFIRLIAVEGTGLLSEVTFSPDNTQIAIGDWDGIASLWDVSTGAKLATFTNKDYVTSVAFSPDGKSLATGTRDHKATLWDINTGKERWSISHKDLVSSVAFSPDGLLLATGSWDSTANLCDVEKGEVRRCFTHQKKEVDISFDSGMVETFNSLGINCIAFSPNGRYFATGDRIASDSKGVTTLWDIESGMAVWDFTHEESATSITFSTDNKYMATRFSGGDTDVRHIADCTTAPIQEGNWAKHKKKPPASHPRGLYGWLVSFSPNGKHLAAIEELSSLKIWDLASGINIKTIDQDMGQAQALSYSHDGYCFGVSRSTKGGTSWNCVTFWKDQEQQIDFLYEELHVDIFSTAVSPDAEIVAIGGDDNKVRLWNRATQKLVNTLSGHTGPIINLAFSPDGTHLVSTGGREWKKQEEDGVVYGYTTADSHVDRTARVWHIETGAEIATLTHISKVETLVFSPDSTCLATASGEDVHLWDTKTWQKNVKLETVGVESLAFSEDGSLLAVGGTGRKPKIQIWNVETVQLVVEFSGHKSDVESVAFSPDGTLLASGSFDGTVLLWDMKPFICT
ncbi:MAG: WD40 repeat domain-containing protein [Candidatus Poribacteria bacterium]|nr:WD40 repeat domain-containing protein [Candidatus Poribacteria bacterium]